MINPVLSAPVSVAPMMDKTNRHFRWFLRLLSKHVLLYSEMITSSAIVYGNPATLLDFDPIEKPLVLQLAGNNPSELEKAVRIAEDWDYDGYNLNVGCPSDRVQHRRFGACLMADHQLVADLLQSMRASTNKPLTIKHRIGIEGGGIQQTSYADLASFVSKIAGGTAVPQRFIIHARIAVLDGLSPKENRQIPPLRYDDVYRLKTEFPNLGIEINGGIRSYNEIDAHLRKCDGVMLGRLSYERPWLFSEIDARYFSENPQSPNYSASKSSLPCRRNVVEAWFRYMERRVGEGMNPRSLVWPILELFASEQGSRRWKQVLSQKYEGNLKSFFQEAMDVLPEL